MLRWVSKTMIIIGCRGLIAPAILFGIFAAFIGCQNTASERSSSSSDQSDASSQSAQAASSSESSTNEPAPINLSSRDQTATEPFNLESGLAIFRTTYEGGGICLLHLQDTNGSRLPYPNIANTIAGMSRTSRAIQVNSGQYVLGVDTCGPWTMAIYQPRPTTAPERASFEGDGTNVTDFFQLSKGPKKAEYTYQGEGNFIFHLLGKDGTDIASNILVNEIGSSSGSTALQIPKEDIYLIQVESQGYWSIQVK